MTTKTAAAEIAAQLHQDTTRTDGTTRLTALTTRALRAVAAELGMRAVAGMRKADLIDRIVELTIGYRLNSAVLRAR